MTFADLQSHDEVQARIWNDERLPPGTREVALAMAWVLHRERQYPPGGGYWKRLRDLLGQEGIHPHWRLYDLIAADAPRYEPPRYPYEGECEGPRLRPYKPRQPARESRCLVSGHHPHLGDCRFTQVYYDSIAYARAAAPAPERDNRICGTRGTNRVVERDMVTGWQTSHWFCSRHLERAKEVRAQLAARGTPPEPIPNTGGLLPRYFAADWAKIYTDHCARSWTSRMVAGWKPPYYGVDADDWPVPGMTVVPKRPRLSLVGPA